MSRSGARGRVASDLFERGAGRSGPGRDPRSDSRARGSTSRAWLSCGGLLESVGVACARTRRPQSVARPSSLGERSRVPSLGHASLARDAPKRAVTTSKSTAGGASGRESPPHLPLEKPGRCRRSGVAGTAAVRCRARASRQLLFDCARLAFDGLFGVVSTASAPLLEEAREVHQRACVRGTSRSGVLLIRLPGRRVSHRGWRASQRRRALPFRRLVPRCTG